MATNNVSTDVQTGRPGLFQTIPPEIIYEILTYQFKDYMSNDYPPTSEKFNENLRNFLRSNLTVNKTFYHICRVLLYKHCNFTTAKRFHNLLESIEHCPELRNIIQIADFQELTSIGLGRSNEMNKSIQNLTNETLLRFLKLTESNLREFLACENIQEDLDENIIYWLLKPGKNLSILDFCGCSGDNLTRSFINALNKLYPPELIPNNMNGSNSNIIIPEPIAYNSQITCLGLNDCTDLPKPVLGKLLKLFPDLQKVDLAHTSIDGQILMQYLPHLKNLTHLSFASCSQLTSRSILEFFSHHPAVTDENNASTLEWLNLSDISHSALWNEVHTMFLLKKLCQYGHNKTLQYLNLDGLPLHQVTMAHSISGSNTPTSSQSTVSITSYNYRHSRRETIFSTVVKTKYYYKCADALIFIKLNFPKLKSLSIRGNNISINKLVEFLSPIKHIDEYPNLTELSKQPQQKLKFINLSRNSYITKWTIQDPNLLTCSDSLCAIEVNFETWQQIEKSNNDNEIISMKYDYKSQKNKVVKWKCFLDVSYGRRHWIYRCDPYLNKDDIEKKSQVGTRFDSSGHKIIEIVKQPDFLKFAQTKISLSCGLVIKSSIRRKECYKDYKPPISQFLTRNGGITFGNITPPIRRPTLPPGGWRFLQDDDDYDDEEEIERDNFEGNNNRRFGIRPTENRNPSLHSHIHHNESHDTPTGLYWDRSMHDLHSFSLQNNNSDNIANNANDIPTIQPIQIENDAEYLNNPELQRRRSQLQLLRIHHRNSNRMLKGNNLHNIHNSNSNILKQNKANSMLKTFLKPSNDGSSNNIDCLSNQPLSKKSVDTSEVAKLSKPKIDYYKHPEQFIYDSNDSVTTKRYQIHFEVVDEYKTFGCVERGMYRYYSLKT
ncbi:Lug1p PWA37_004863 [Arxiozyma heterogenica]|uniref:Lug1p n=1 Tax=Arxiozyma heterogenica TaxID=278026 RepID=UPI002F013F09